MADEATAGERRRYNVPRCVYRVKVISGAAGAAGANEEGRGR